MVELNDISQIYRMQAWSYLPCHPTCKLHDLNCGHRVQTETGEQCGSNCTSPSHPALTPFICRTCITQAVLEGLGLKSDSTVEESWSPNTIESDLATGIVDALVEDEIHTLTDRSHRDATPVPKTNGLAEFVREFGTKVLRISEREVRVVENMFRDMGIKTMEEKMETMENVFAALGLADYKTGGQQDEAVRWLC